MMNAIHGFFEKMKNIIRAWHSMEPEPDEIGEAGFPRCGGSFRFYCGATDKFAPEQFDSQLDEDFLDE
ncbi:MAG: hypothetical protein IJT94_06105 [Oscillibacter sp.]|nr:hypothetical protein [Oscillibacter sp.]